MILRGIAARRLLSLTIFLLTVCVVAGTLVAVGFSRLTSVSQGSAGSLVLLGLVGIAAQSVESVRRREHDLALARLRGRRGLRLLYFAAAEPCAVVLSGAVAGVGAGWLVETWAVDTWLPAGTTFSLTSDEWVAVGIVTLACLVIVLASSWRLARMPLMQQLAGARRPRAVSTLALFLQLVLVLGAVVAIYQAHQTAKARVDWVSLVSPAVVGLAAGQILIWLLMAALAVLLPRRRAIGLGWYITLRRLLRRADSLALIRLVVAAGVVFGVAASASAAAQSWREERARLQVGAPVSYPVTGGALRAYAAAHTADPGGQWLLPVASYTSDAQSGSRRVFVDTSRWKAVVGGFFAGTPSAGVTSALEKFPPSSTRAFVQGDTITATLTTASLDVAVHIRLNLTYVDDTGNLAVLHLQLDPADGQPAGQGLTRFTAPLTDCRVSCNPVSLDMDGYTEGPLHLVSLDIDNQPLISVAAGFQVSTERYAPPVRRVGNGLTINVIQRFYYHQGNPVGTFRPLSVEPAVSTGAVGYVSSNGTPTVEGVDGFPRPVHVLATVPVLPFVGTSGTLLDLGRVLAGSGTSIPSTAAVVLAKADSPRDVIAALNATGAVGPPTTYNATLRRLDETPRAQGTRLYLLIAAFAALIALVSLASAVAQQRPERRQEAASLRSVGVHAGQINGAYRREALLLALVTVLGTGLATWTACRVLLSALPLVSGWVFAPPLDASPRLVWISLTALVSGVVVAGMTYAAFRRVGRAAAPRLLREDIV